MLTALLSLKVLKAVWQTAFNTFSDDKSVSIMVFPKQLFRQKAVSVVAIPIQLFKLRVAIVMTFHFSCLDC